MTVLKLKCNGCGAEPIITFREETSEASVIDLIREAHEKLASECPVPAEELVPASS